MNVILPQIETVEKLCRRQTATSAALRLSRHCLSVDVDEGVLLYHTMTGELLLLSSDESASMFDPGDVRDELAARWYLVPEDFDEHAYAAQIRQVIKLLTKRKQGIYHYVIFPTTDCNARCFYCYELVRPRMTMSQAVARDAAAYMLAHRAGHDLRINWFGGEPLYNTSAIDAITRDLTAAGAAFSSQMTTNGYLFDKRLVQRARDEWKLESVQITLDGTEERYNRTKAYIQIDGNPYLRVMENIALLAEAGVEVTLRLNLTLDNKDDLWALADELEARFASCGKVCAYTVLVKDFGKGALRQEHPDEMLAAYQALQEHLAGLIIGWRWYPRDTLSENQCMADNDNWLTILPDGRVGKCEHESDDKLVGSIYGEALDGAALDAWKERVSVPHCADCLFYPGCVLLKQCDWHRDGCTEFDRQIMRVNLRHRVLNAYERYVLESESDDGIE